MPLAVRNKDTAALEDEIVLDVGHPTSTQFCRRFKVDQRVVRSPDSDSGLQLSSLALTRAVAGERLPVLSLA